MSRDWGLLSIFYQFTEIIIKLYKSNVAVPIIYIMLIKA